MGGLRTQPLPLTPLACLLAVLLTELFLSLRKKKGATPFSRNKSQQAGSPCSSPYSSPGGDHDGHSPRARAGGCRGVGGAETAQTPLRAGPEKTQRVRRRVVKPQPPLAQGPPGTTEPSGLGLQGDRAVDRGRPNSRGAGGGSKLPGSRGFFRKEGGARQGGAGWSRDGRGGRGLKLPTAGFQKMSPYSSSLLKLGSKSQGLRGQARAKTARLAWENESGSAQGGGQRGTEPQALQDAGGAPGGWDGRTWADRGLARWSLARSPSALPPSLPRIPGPSRPRAVGAAEEPGAGRSPGAAGGPVGAQGGSQTRGESGELLSSQKEPRKGPGQGATSMPP